MHITIYAMGVKEVLGELRKDAPSIILLILLGIIIDQSLIRGSIVFSSLRVTFGTISLYEMIKLLANFLNKRRQERIRQEKLLVEDLKKWMKEETFSNIGYSRGQIIGPIKHKDLKLIFFKEVVKVLQDYNIFSLWEEGKTTSDRLITETKRALETFHKIVDTATEKIPLKKSYKIGTLSEPYMSMLRIRETIYEDVCGQPMNLKFYPDARKNNVSMKFLNDGAVQLAWGKVKVLNCLKSIIEKLIEDENVRNQIGIYTEAKRKLDSGELFQEFYRKLNKLISYWERFHEFRPQN